MKMGTGTIGLIVILAIVVLVTLTKSVTTIRQAEKGIVERFGRYKETLDPGLRFLVPFVDSLRARIDMRETVLDIEPQAVITKDNVGITVDAVVYYYVTDAKAVRYEVANFHVAMSKLAKAEREKRATILDAEAYRQKKILEAEGDKQNAILVAEGDRQSAILRAEGEAKAIENVSKAASEFFVGNAQLLKQLEVTQASLQNNAKLVISDQSRLINVLGLSEALVGTQATPGKQSKPETPSR